MRQRHKKWLAAAVVASFIMVGWQVWTSGQQPGTEKAKDAAAANRLEFEVVQSFDAKYEGDTPGHMGRAGGLANRKPHIALGDPVFRGDQRVGMVTGLLWNRTNGSLDIEFDPAEKARVAVGDAVWLVLDNTNSAATSEPPRAK
jgi:hypothetical protein